MDPLDQRLHFLDLSDASEADQRLIERVLYSSKTDLQLPWATEKRHDELIPDWAQHSYDDRERTQEEMCRDESEAGDAHAPQPPRNSVFVHPQMWCIYPTPTGVYIPQAIPAYNTPQPYAFAEMDSGPRPQPPRGSKKIDKKPEPNFPAQYVVSYPPIYQPAFVPMPMYPAADYHPAYLPAPDQQPNYTEEQSYAQALPPVEVPPVEMKEEVEEIPVEQPQAEVPTHEHMCYRANVTLKAPKRKSPDEVPVEVVEAPPVTAPVVPPIVNDVSQRLAEPEPTPAEDDVKQPSAPNEFPDLGSTGKNFPSLNPTPTESPVNQNMKSWVSLFVSQPTQMKPTQVSDMKTRPLARVSPFDSTSEKTAPVTAAPIKTVPVDNSRLSIPESTSSVNSTLLDDPYSHQLGEVLKSYQLDHRAVYIKPCGLTNRSNWCYVNAILQALVACPSFYNLMKALPVPSANDKRSASRTPIIEALVGFVNEFPPLHSNTKGKRGKEDPNYGNFGRFEPTGVYKVLDKIRGENGFSVEGRQEDAEEFLSCLLNGLNDEMFEVLKLIDGGDSKLTNGDTSDSEADGWKEKTGRKNKGSITRRTVCGKTPISDIFRGQLRNRVSRAGVESTDNVQPFFTLQLDIEKASSVKDALELLVGKDPLEGMTCSKTNQEIEAWTQVTLEDLPLILILHLKCFDYKQDGCSKIMKNVDFKEHLKVDPKLMSVNKQKYVGKQKNYKLVAVVYHDGKEATKGHYVTDAFHIGLNRWIRYDDSIVKSVDLSDVLKPRPTRVPYLLYYRRSDTLSSTTAPSSSIAPSRTPRP